MLQYFRPRSKRSFWLRRLPFGRKWQNSRSITISSRRNLQTPGRQKKGKKGARATPAPSKQLVVPAPQDQPHIPKKVYADCRHRINDKKDAERHRSPIRVNANLRDSRLHTLGDKSPIRKVQGLDAEVESDDEYVPSKDIESSYRSEAPPEYSKAKPSSSRRTSEDYSSEAVPSRDPAIRLLFQRVQRMEDDRTRSQVPGPFTERVKNSRQDREVRPLRIPFYTGVEDPLTHLHSFQSAVGCSGLSDEGQCLLFLSSLTEAALNWFYRLEPGTGESAPKVYPGQESSYPPGRADGSSVSNKRKDNREDRQGSSKKGRGKHGRNDHRAPLPNHDRTQEVFTLLNTTYEAVLMNEHEQIPKPSRKPNRQDTRETGKFCRYHHQSSHNTEDCISLRKIVECLIREGKLDQYIAKPQQAPAPNANRQINMISTISGGPTLAGPSNRSMKQYVRAAHYPQVFGTESDRHRKFAKVGWEPITFSEEEEEGIIYPHDDPMIIRAEIADYDVGRVLIDTGSSVNVIFADAFRGLGVADSMVNRQITPLLSFSGDLVQPVGSVSLPIAFGVAPRKTMTYDQFLIVDCPTAYNVIIGRTALTRVKAHLSPHMLLMKFPTCNGTGAVRGDQLSARTCYATALKSVAPGRGHVCAWATER
ncbi:unnamed protein product [Prunus brigantina]